MCAFLGTSRMWEAQVFVNDYIYLLVIVDLKKEGTQFI